MSQTEKDQDMGKLAEDFYDDGWRRPQKAIDDDAAWVRKKHKEMVRINTGKSKKDTKKPCKNDSSLKDGPS